MKNLLIRRENDRDADDIERIIAAAFEHHPYSNQIEHILVRKLRDAGAMMISLVAELDGEVVGHIAFSPVSISGQQCDWYALAPVAVFPPFQRQGIGSALIRTGLAELRELGAGGCVLVGEPDHYRRFGFAVSDDLTMEAVPPSSFSFCLSGRKAQPVEFSTTVSSMSSYETCQTPSQRLQSGMLI